jgi:hypothetical protein
LVATGAMVPQSPAPWYHGHVANRGTAGSERGLRGIRHAERQPSAEDRHGAKRPIGRRARRRSSCSPSRGPSRSRSSNPSRADTTSYDVDAATAVVMVRPALERRSQPPQVPGTCALSCGRSPNSETCTMGPAREPVPVDLDQIDHVKRPPRHISSFSPRR